MTININHVKSRYSIQTLADLAAAGETSVTTLNLDTGHVFVKTSAGRILLVSDWRDEAGQFPLIPGFVRDVTQMYTNKSYVAGNQIPHSAEHLATLKTAVKAGSSRLTGLTGPQATMLATLTGILG